MSSRNIAYEEDFLHERESLDHYFQEQYFQKEETEVSVSPFSDCCLTIEHYYHEEGIRRYMYTKGIINCFGEQKVEVKRNLSPFIHRWIKIDDKEYLLCGQDYQGYSIVDLQNGEIKHYVPEGANSGIGFCWAEIHAHEGTNVIAVEGCVWACEYEIVFYDISEPMILPYKELKRISPYGDVKGWINNCEFAYYGEGEPSLKVFQF
ncbi:hypothetical protein [uncultured Brevibacillus sp.]|uniref:hypothetical protein n=1 Tax=uncultured Brevibacillus sp. TaxID=169970 RepID=UPI002599FC2A|nr:hypothetical protein [uncultured Brevibacillus sp.]